MRDNIQLRESFYRERRRIEGTQMAEKGRQRQRTLEECIGVAGRDVQGYPHVFMFILLHMSL